MFINDLLYLCFPFNIIDQDELIIKSFDFQRSTILMPYDSFMVDLTKKGENMSFSLLKKGLDFNSYYLTFPPNVFNPLWVPLIQKFGFYSALAYINTSIDRFIMCVNKKRHDLQLIKKQHDYIISVIFPLVLTYKTQNCSTQQIINRAREMKKSWKITSNICSSLIFFMECNESKQSDPQSKKLKIINDLLIIFDTNQSKLDYKIDGLQLLYQSVSQTVYSIKVWDQSYEEIYKKLSNYNREKIIYFLSKIKKKESTLASILEQITNPKNNQSDISKIINISTLFLLAQNWDKFKQAESRLKETTVIQILAEAFERLMYLVYNEDTSIGMLFLHFLNCSKFTMYDEMKQAIAYHLLALYKFYLYCQKVSNAKLIEKIWGDKMKGVKLNEVYSQFSPSFVTKSQWGQERILQEAETKSINSRSSNSKVLTIGSNRTSKSKLGRSTRGSTLIKRLKCIEEELRRCNLERIYLMMQSLKKFYLQWEDRRVDEGSRNAVVSLIILLIKKIQAKIHFRYNCSLLKKIIYLEIMELKEKCFVQLNFQYNQKNVSLGLFECCYVDKGELNFENFIKFHEKNNYEDTLETVYSIKSLYDDLNSNNLSSYRLQTYEEQLFASQFQSKVYQLYKNELNESKKVDAKRLIIICKLLLLKSTNITNNLLVNYVYLMLKHDKISESAYRKKVDAYSRLMNAQISMQSNDQRVKIFLIMGEIFEQFNEQSFKLMDASIGNKYFELLRRKEHAPYYYLYYQFYLKINYLKESLYFLELHSFSQKQPNSQLIKNAIQIYQRLNTPFKTYLKSILKELKLDESELDKQLHSQQKQANKFSLELFVLKMRNQIDNDICLPNHYQEYYIRGNPKIDLWLNYYYRYLVFFIEELASHKESEEINERLRRYSIVVKYLYLKIDMRRQSDLVVTYNDLRIIIEVIQRLRNDDDRNHFYLYFLELLERSTEVPIMEEIYLQNLLKCKKYSEMLSYLRKNLKNHQSNAKIQSDYLCYLIKYHFERSQYDRCLSMITVLAQRKQKLVNFTEVYHMQLECKYKSMLNYTIQEYLSLINRCIASSKAVPTDNHFKYYFKIFRMLFNRYNFACSAHNDLFLQTYFNFIDANALLTEHVYYIAEAILYLLRFVAEKFDYSTNSNKNYEKLIVEKFKGKTEHFIPFCNYLIKRISFNTAKNHVIRGILKVVLTEHPNECVWTLAFLKNFSFKTQKNSRLSAEQTNQIERLAQIFKQVVETLQTKKALNVDHLNWIDNLVKLALSEADTKKQKTNEFRQSGVPGELVFMFNKDYYINRIEDVRVLSNGKSAPLEIVFNLLHIRQRHYLTVKVIVKGNVGVKKYRMESNTANFFEEIALIDRDITYKIIHLSKYLVAIEHRANCGTLNSLIADFLPEFRKVEGLILTDIQRRKATNNTDRRLLEIFDSHNRYENRVRFSEVIYYKAKNSKDWWRRYSNFVRTHAQWSFLGYVVGLGDRHCDNILLTDDAKLIHIDFEYSLDTGLKLPCPEWVPFRLTSCLVQPLGLLGVFGMFFAQMVATARRFEEQEHSIWKALSHFVGSMDTNVCEEILQRSRFFNLGVGCTEEGVAKLIQSGKDPELLRLMFEGWRAYL